MRALTLQQPWADLVAQGVKTIENRTWRTEYRGDLVIHAAKTIDRAAWRILRSGLGAEVVPGLDQLATGSVVGVVALTDIHGATWPDERHAHGCDVWGEKHDSGWHWVLADSTALDPIPATGKLSLWTPDEDLADRIAAAVEAMSQ